MIEFDGILRGEIEVCVINGRWVIRREWAPHLPGGKIFEYLDGDNWTHRNSAKVFITEQEARAHLAAFILCQ